MIIIKSILLGNMVPRKEVEVPNQVKLAQQILLKLGDYSSLSDEESLSSNIKALNEILLAVGRFLSI